MHFSNKIYKLVFISFIVIISYCEALENGLGKTPPMGWLTWQRYRCQTDCKNYPNDCIKLVANLMKNFLVGLESYVFGQTIDK